MRQISILIGLFFVGLIYGAGCHEQDQITRYRVPKQKTATAQVAQEMLVALTERDGEVYFFKTAGSTERIERHRGLVRKFLQQLQFPSDGKASPTWQLPQGWSERKGSGMRIATITLDKPPQALTFDEATLPEACEVHRDGWLGKAGRGDEVRDGRGACAQLLQDRQAGRVGEPAEELGLHSGAPGRSRRGGGG